MAAVPGIRPPKFLSPFGVAFICIIHINYRGRGRGEWGGRVPDRLAQLEKHPFDGGCVWRQTS